MQSHRVGRLVNLETLSCAQVLSGTLVGFRYLRAAFSRSIDLFTVNLAYLRYNKI